MSFSPVVQVRKLLGKMKSERSSPRLKRFPSRTLSEEANSDSEGSSSRFHIPAYKSRKSSKQEITGPNHFESLPQEAALYIFSFLDAKSLGRVAQVSQEMNMFADDDLIWKALTMYEFGIDSELQNLSWKKSYAYLDELFADGLWEGMSKWLEPAGYETEQKTTARLHFARRSYRTVTSPIVSRNSPNAIHRVDSQTLTSVVKPPALSAARPLAPRNHQGETYRIIGSGITVNDNHPCPFKIEGSRQIQDATGCSFEWNKQFEKHTSIYFGKMDFEKRSVTGTISYQEGSMHWKGIFSYTKVQNRRSKLVLA